MPSVLFWTAKTCRYCWTYREVPEKIQQKNHSVAINPFLIAPWGNKIPLELLLFYMNKLAELLRSNKIDLSIAVYPWPGTLKYDIQNNNQLKIWKNFCVSNCKKFYNFMGPFYDLLAKNKFVNVYRKVYIENDVHFNEEGHRIIAEHFLKLYKN